MIRRIVGAKVFGNITDGAFQVPKLVQPFWALFGDYWQQTGEDMQIVAFRSVILFPCR
jgi:hypothetical protein